MNGVVEAVNQGKGGNCKLLIANGKAQIDGTILSTISENRFMGRNSGVLSTAGWKYVGKTWARARRCVTKSRWVLSNCVRMPVERLCVFVFGNESGFKHNGTTDTTEGPWQRRG